MSAWQSAALWGCGFACAAGAGMRLGAVACRNVVAFEDGPRSQRPPSLTFVAIAAGVGIVAGFHATTTFAPAMFCFLTFSLAAASDSDLRCGIVPDWFTLVPLALILAVSLARLNLAPALSALVVLVPFALTASLSGGRGMGWGDVKLAVLGAAVLGLQTSLVAFTVACLGAVLVAVLRKRQGEPIAFAPYLAAGSALAMLVPDSGTLGA